MSKTVTIRMSRKNALELGLLTCKCGHSFNNHFCFSSGRHPCAHCSCKEYRETAVWGGVLMSDKEKP